MINVVDLVIDVSRSEWLKEIMVEDELGKRWAH